MYYVYYTLIMYSDTGEKDKYCVLFLDKSMCNFNVCAKVKMLFINNISLFGVQALNVPHGTKH
jgi:hypothetical protein